MARIFPFIAALYLVVFSGYAELSWTDFAWAGRPATAVVVGLVAVALVSALLAIVAAGLAAPIRGRWVLYVFLRRYVLLILSRVLVVVTVPLRFPLRTTFLVFAPFAAVYLALAIFPFSYNGIFFSERLASARLPMKLGIGCLPGGRRARFWHGCCRSGSAVRWRSRSTSRGTCAIRAVGQTCKEHSMRGSAR